MAVLARLSLFVLAAGFLAAPVEGAVQNPLSTYSVVTLGDMVAGSDTRGRVFVGGNLTGTATDIAINLQGIVMPGDPVLQVVGNVSNGNNNIQVGSAVIGGTLTSTNFNLNQAGNTVRVGGAATNSNVNGGTLIANTGVVPDITGIQSALINGSAALAAESANSTLNVSGSNRTLNAMPSGPANRAVFQVTFAQLFGDTNSLVDLNLNGANEVVINVSGVGGTIATNFGNGLTSLFNTPDLANVLWNFHEATDILLQRRFFGSILAPFAEFENTSEVEGSIGVDTFIQRGQIHLPLSNVPFPMPPVDPPEVPEPSMAIVFAGLMAFGLNSRRFAR